METKGNSINCPNCGQTIDVSELLIHQLSEQVQTRYELQIAEKNNMIESLRNQAKEMQRKLEQGSMQVQGETQELLIESFLKSTFPLDSIEEVAKGVKGGDCIQYVNTREQQNIGSILYESKRTKAWSSSWIPKFKEDLQAANATIGVIITSVLPADMQRMGQREGIWICTFSEFKGLCLALREGIVLYGTAVANQENKGDKMQLLFSYLTSNEFKLQIEGIVAGFTELENELVKERRAMELIWKRREKQIKKVLDNSISMYSSIRAIAGNSVKKITALELTTGDTN